MQTIRCGLLLPMFLGLFLRVSLYWSQLSVVLMAEPIEMLFGIWTQVCPLNHVLDGALDLLREVGNFCGISQPIVKSMGNMQCVVIFLNHIK